LHLGHGSEDPKLEDFKQDAEFRCFVDAIAEPDTTLIINGDFVDFAQIPPYDVPPPSHLLWTEDASLKKLEAALTAHADCFDSLKRFVSKGARLRVVIGNHDLDLAWEKVQARLREYLAAPPGDHLCFVIGHTIYEGVWIEHGHEFTPENSPVDPKNFIHDWNGRRYLERVWGTDFMLRFYNDVERHFSYADKVKPTIAVICYGLRKRLVGFREFLHLVLFLKQRGLPLGAAISALSKDSPEEIRFEEIRFDNLARELGDSEWMKLAADIGDDETSDHDFKAAVGTLSSEEKAVLAAPASLELSGTGVDALSELGAEKGIFKDREEAAAKERLAEPGVTHVVFGHTHRVVDGALKGHLFNPGTWIPRLNLRSPEVRAKIHQQGLTEAMLNDDSLFRADRLAVEIVPESTYQAHVKLIEVPSFDDWRE
jgi:UDP-2,3-diacylglucosamine pyrophosphatase LpxH